MSAEEDKRLALTVIEALNARDLSRWSPKLADDYAGEYPGVPVLNKTQSIGYNQRFVTAFPTFALTSTASSPRAIKSSYTGR